MAGEDISQYHQLRDVLMTEIKPVTVVEYLAARDIVAAVWELLRLHGFKAGMLNAHMLAVLKDQGHRVWSSQIGHRDPLPALLKLFRRTQAGDRDARQDLEKLLAKHQLALSDIAATAYESNIAAQLQTDQMIHAALQRREAVC